MERLERVSCVCVCWYDTDGACVVMPERERGYSNTCSAC